MRAAFWVAASDCDSIVGWLETLVGSPSLCLGDGSRAVVSLSGRVWKRCVLAVFSYGFIKILFFPVPLLLLALTPRQARHGSVSSFRRHDTRMRSRRGGAIGVTLTRCNDLGADS